MTLSRHRVYVLIDAEGRVTAASSELDPLVPEWKHNFRSLQMMGPDGQIVPTSAEDYDRAAELSRGLRRRKALA